MKHEQTDTPPESMVVEFVADNLLGALVAWYNRKKDQKDAVRKTLTDLRIAIKATKLHMDFARLPNGQIMTGKYAPQFPHDIEHLFRAIETHRDDLGADLAEELFAFQDYLVAYNKELNCLSMDTDTDRYETVILETIERLDRRIGELLKALG